MFLAREDQISRPLCFDFWMERSESASVAKCSNILFFKRHVKNRNIRAACLEFGDEDVTKGDDSQQRGVVIVRKRGIR